MSAFLPILLLLSDPVFSLPGPSDVSLTHKPASFLQNLKRQYTGLGSYAMPPPDRCYRRSDTKPACPYGGQCRPDMGYTCQTYCVSYGQTLDNQMSCNLPCSYNATGLQGEAPYNPMHCALLGDRSRISCESGWACYRQFSELGPTFEQRPPVCSPRYDECDLDDGSAAAAALAPAEEQLTVPVEQTAPLEPAASISSASTSTPVAAAPALSPAQMTAQAPSTEEADETTVQLPVPAAIIIVNVDDTEDDRRRKRQAPKLTCKPSHRCVRDPRPSLSLPTRKESIRGICVPETAKRCISRAQGGVWSACGERGYCAEVAAPSTGADAGKVREGLCVPLLAGDWADSPLFAGATVANVSVAVSAGLRSRAVLRPMC